MSEPAMAAEAVPYAAAITPYEGAEVVLSRGDLETIRRQIVVPQGVRPPSPLELDDFGRYSIAQRLNPFDRQIYLMFLNGAWRPYIGVHGRLSLAFRTGLVSGMEGPLFCHSRTDEQHARNEPPDWDELWDDDEPPHAAKFVVYRAGMVKGNGGATGIAHWKRYAYEKDGKGGERLKRGLWQTNPTLMLGYKAITRALNMAFPGVMPPAPERDDDAGLDEPEGYVRDEAGSESPPTDRRPPGRDVIEGRARDVNPNPRPDRPYEFRVPTQEQTQQLRAALVSAGLSSDKDMKSYIAELLGRERVTWSELSVNDYERVAAALGQPTTEEEPFG
jgi:hypothetical protein